MTDSSFIERLLQYWWRWWRSYFCDLSGHQLPSKWKRPSVCSRLGNHQLVGAAQATVKVIASLVVVEHIHNFIVRIQQSLYADDSLCDAFSLFLCTLIITSKRVLLPLHSMPNLMLWIPCIFQEQVVCWSLSLLPYSCLFNQHSPCKQSDQQLWSQVRIVCFLPEHSSSSYR